MSVSEEILELAQVSRRPALRRPPAAWLPPAIYLALAIVICRHLLADPMHRVVAANPHDESLISYLLQAEPTQLIHGHNPLFLTSLNAPDGVNTMWNTGLLLPALLLAPITMALGGTFTFNLLLVAGLAGSAFSAYTVARRWVRRRLSAFLAGLVYGFGPAITHQAVGHLHLVVAFLPPLLLAGLVDVLRGPYRTGTSVRLGLLGAAQLLTGEELLACSVLAGSVVCLVLAASRPRTALRAWSSWLRGLAIAALAFVTVAAGPLLFQLFGPRQQYGSPFAFDIFKSDLTAFVTPDQLQPLHSLASRLPAADLLAGSPEHNAFLGWPLLLLALTLLVTRWGDLRVRAAGCTAVVLGVFSLGGTLRAGGTTTDVHLPWSHLERLPLLDGLLPNRFGLLVAGLVGLLLAVGTDLALDRVPPRAHRTALVLALVVLLAPLTPLPLAATARTTTPYLISSGLSHRYLASGATVLALPFPTPTDTRAMDWQADDGLRWSMPGGFFIGPKCEGRHCTARAIIGGSQPPTASLLAKIGDGRLAADALTAKEIIRANRDLQHWGVTEVLVGPGSDQRELVAAMTLVLGRSGEHVADCWLWSVG
jgi:hypothetical protein